VEVATLDKKTLELFFLLVASRVPQGSVLGPLFFLVYSRYSPMERLVFMLMISDHSVFHQLQTCNCAAKCRFHLHLGWSKLSAEMLLSTNLLLLSLLHPSLSMPPSCTSCTRLNTWLESPFPRMQLCLITLPESKKADWLALL